MDFKKMDSAAWTVIISCVFSASGSSGCVRTDSVHRVQEGSDVRLACMFSTCPGPLDHTVDVSWEFNDTDFVFFHYGNQSFVKWPNAEGAGNVMAGNFSVLLRSVTPRHTGTYTCNVRPLRSRFIYKNHTVLTVAPSRSGRRFMNSDPSVSSPLWLILGFCGAGLVLLAVGVYWRRGRSQHSSQRKNQDTAVSTEAQHPHKDKDTDHYVTLRGCKAPPPVSKEESIYVTMHGQPVPPAIQAPPSHSRKAIPADWYDTLPPPHVKNEDPPPYVPAEVTLVKCD